MMEYGRSLPSASKIVPSQGSVDGYNRTKEHSQRNFRSVGWRPFINFSRMAAFAASSCPSVCGPLASFTRRVSFAVHDVHRTSRACRGPTAGSCCNLGRCQLQGGKVLVRQRVHSVAFEGSDKWLCWLMSRLSPITWCPRTERRPVCIRVRSRQTIPSRWRRKQVRVTSRA